jgi:hypothetical protein
MVIVILTINETQTNIIKSMWVWRVNTLLPGPNFIEPHHTSYKHNKSRFIESTAQPNILFLYGNASQDQLTSRHSLFCYPAYTRESFHA